MKPFNLEEALAGKPVVTRDGRSAKIAGHNREADEDYRIVGWLSDVVFGWREDGKYQDSGDDSRDLFMAEEELYVGVDSFGLPTSVYDNLNKLKIDYPFITLYKLTPIEQ